ncbi:hypothetical protein [Trichormus azollae]|uniref:hypothetical protein n=1 Tax=Trichormus azollae TaxID=1164 RepID=UPI003D334F3B
MRQNIASSYGKEPATKTRQRDVKSSIHSLIKPEENLVNFYIPYPIDIDNYLAELRLLLPLTKGKFCGGSVSMERFQHTTNLLTVIQTCHPQALSLIKFLTNLLK